MKTAYICHPIVSSTGKYFGVVNREELKKIPELCVIFKKYSKYLDLKKLFYFNLDKNNLGTIKFINDIESDHYH